MNAFGISTVQYVLAQNLFLKILALSYFFAFWSLFNQVLGLYGSQGIIPIHEQLRGLKTKFHSQAYWQLPTLFWWDASDMMLRLAAGIGMACSVIAFLGILPALFLLICWGLYLSYMSVGLVFLGFQWDSLLLEVGFIGMFFAIQSPPPIFLLIALWFLLFRFMLSSGLVKLLSGCPEWRDLTAMTYHYETQPLPNKIGYYAHQQPLWVSQASTIATFFLEIVVPFMIFGTHAMRTLASVLLLFLQVLIAATGNYAFFNLLTAALCILLLPNSALQWLMGPLDPITLGEPFYFLQLVLNFIGMILIILNALQLSTLFVSAHWIHTLLHSLSPFYIINSYGLFARMTTVRDEIIIEGSENGKDWHPYEFTWKPGDVTVGPKQVAPYHPRLDWQMWFAALSSYQANPWFTNLLVRLLEGSPDVEALFKKNPFPYTPPRFIRALRYNYHFTNLEEKKKSGRWWMRKLKGAYTPTFSSKSAS